MRRDWFRASWVWAPAMGLLCLSAAALAQSGKDVETTAGNIVTKPLKDMNVVKEDIPPILQAAAKAPYSLKGLSSCQSYSAEIAKLNAVLGPDLDKIKPKPDQSAGEVALGEVEKAAGKLIPGSGIVRKVSGAEAHERKVKGAIQSGWLRRAYLKGSAQAKGCKI